MAFDCSWLAYQGVEKAAVLALAGFRYTGEAIDVPQDVASCAEITTGWTIFYVNDSTYASKHIGRLSMDHAVLSVTVQGYVPLSWAAFYIRTKRFWSVMHDGEKGADDLESDVTAPPEFAPLKEKWSRTQKLKHGDGIDYLYNIPIDLAAAICGFRHDRFWPKTGKHPFTIVAPIA